MPAVAAFALLMQAAPAPVAAANSAIKAFREACIEGSFKLSPSRGRILTPREHNYVFYDYLAWGQTVANRTIVKLNNPPKTYLIFIEYKQLQPKSIARTCALDSNSVSKREAMGAFLEGLPDKDVSPQWIPDMYLPVWNSDHPELGYRKLFRFRDDGSVVLEIGMYPAAATQMNSGTTKQ
jgi:hypothetical protein